MLVLMMIMIMPPTAGVVELEIVAMVVVEFVVGEVGPLIDEKSLKDCPHNRRRRKRKRRKRTMERKAIVNEERKKEEMRNANLFHLLRSVLAIHLEKAFSFLNCYYSYFYCYSYWYCYYYYHSHYHFFSFCFGEGYDQHYFY
jgi:hypothetical protein